MELVFSGVTKKYGDKTVCDNLSMKMTKGVYGLLGANGAGKTTLMRMLAGVLDTTEGTIAYDSFDVKSEDYRNILGYLPQSFGYYPEFKARDFMLYLAALKGLEKKEARERTKELLALVSLEKEARQKIRTFSGGMKQRLGIAQAMLNDPKVLILDEPTAGLDPKERIRFRNLISRLGNDRIVLLSTHIVSDVEQIADTILVMKDGRFICKGNREELAGEMTGKVWESQTDETEAEKICASHSVTNIRKEEEKVLLRVVSDRKPHLEAVCVKGTLEDLYLYYFSSANPMDTDML